MTSRGLTITEVRFAPAPENHVRGGLLGWTSFLINGQIRAEGVAVRRTQQGRLALSFPSRDDGWGRRWTYLRPIDDAARLSIERQVLSQLGWVA